MHSFVAYTLLASATLSVALDPRFEFPDTVPLMKRQQPGTPQYACHEDCGLLITLGREDGYCDNDEWNERYGRCMTCANTYNIWQYYRNGVTSAAKECGLSPTPKPSGSSAASTTAEDKPSSTAAEEPKTTEAEEAETTAAEQSATDDAEESATAAPEKTTTAADDAAEATSTSAGAEPEETKGPDSETTGESKPSETAKPTTLTTQPAATTEAASPTETDADSGAGHSSVDEIGTIGVTATPAPTPSGVVVSSATKQFGFTTAMVVVALAMLGLY